MILKIVQLEIFAISRLEPLFIERLFSSETGYFMGNSPSASWDNPLSKRRYCG